MIWFKTHDRHRRHRAKVLRVDRLQQRLGKPRKFCIQFDLHPGGKKGEPFEKALHERIGADLFGLAIQRQSPGNFRKLLRELGRRLPKMRELDVVMVQEPAVHGAARFGSRIIREQPQIASQTVYLPVSRSISVRIKSCSGNG